MQERAVDPRVGPPVDGIAQHRMADGREVHADLVGAPGLERHRETRGVLVAVDHLVVRARLPPAGAHRHPRRVAHRAANRRVDGAVGGLGRPRPRPRRNAARPRGRRARARGRRTPRAAGHDQESAGLAVEAVHDARARRLADPGQVVPREQAVHERAVAVSGAGMHHQPGRLVDHHEVVVLVDDDHRHAGVGRGERGHLGLAGPGERAPRLEPRAPCDDATVDGHRVAVDERAHLTARPTGEQRERTVDALARERLGDHDRRHDVSAAHGSARHTAGSDRRRARVGSGFAEAEHDQQDRADRDRGVGDVERRERADPHEVDDVTAQHTGRAEDPVAQVAERATQHERQRDHGPAVGRAAQRPHQPDGEPDREHREHEGRVRERGERATGIAGDVELDVVADDRERVGPSGSRRPTPSSAGRRGPPRRR